jgi:hypothetical protein
MIEAANDLLRSTGVDPSQKRLRDPKKVVVAFDARYRQITFALRPDAP